MKWPSSLVIVRHGQSTQNAVLDLIDDNLEEILKQKSIRDMVVALTERGHRQAQQTGLYLRDHPRFDVCFSSPYVRTLETA